MIKLTDKAFWENYWNNKTNLISNISEHNYFGKIYEKLFKMNKINSSIELGGFPGYQSIYIKKHYSVDTTLFDFYIDRRIIEKLLLHNNADEKSIKIIEGDLFDYKPINKYDLVFSIGLVEHFEDTDKIIELHTSFLSENGVLLIIIPNFKGINGLIQKLFDKENYDKHYIPCMELTVLKNSFEKNNLKVIDTSYYGKFSIWLENEDKKNFILKYLVKTIWVTGKIFFKVFPVDTKFFSPYIIAMAKK